MCSYQTLGQKGKNKLVMLKFCNIRVKNLVQFFLATVENTFYYVYLPNSVIKMTAVSHIKYLNYLLLHIHPNRRDYPLVHHRL